MTASPLPPSAFNRQDADAPLVGSVTSGPMTSGIARFQTSASPAPAVAALMEYLHQICPAGGRFSRVTFNTLASCLIRMVRDQNFPGLVLINAPKEDPLWGLTIGLEHRQTMRVIPVMNEPAASGDDGDEDHAPFTGLSPLNNPFGDLAGEPGPLTSNTRLLLILTNRLCTCLYWSGGEEDLGEDTLCEGGWSFHPADCRAFAEQLTRCCGDRSEALLQLIHDTPIDRRYDERLSLMLTSLIQRLENRNQTLSLTLERERQLQKKLVESERLAAIGHLCTAIAHEIRNPLGLVDLYAGLVQAELEQAEGPVEELRAKLDAQVQQIREATQHLDHILTGLTQYARPVRLEREATCLPVLLDDVCQFVEPSYREKGVLLKTLEYDADQLEIYTVMADGGKLRQALLNLLKNALEATPAGKSVTAVCGSRGPDDPWVYLKIIDEGAGIAPEVLPKLFTPYFTTKGSAGTGLGLAEVKKIAQAHQGKVEILRSQVGRGATFALALPKQSISS